jgi:hypothetical protein
VSRRHLFLAADLARALKVAQQARLTIARIEIEPSGKIVIVTGLAASDDGPEEARRALDAVRRRNAEERAKRLARESPR